MSPETLEWLNARGANIDGDYLILEHWCPHLSYDGSVSTCDIHYKDNYPLLCRRYHGHGRFFIPSGCVYFDEESRNEQTKLVEDAIALSSSKIKDTDDGENKGRGLLEQKKVSLRKQRQIKTKE